MNFSLAIKGTRRDVLRAGAAGAAMISLGSHAQSVWPVKPVNLIVPFPAGGGTDAFARPMSAQFSRLTGKTLVIDNRGGAGAARRLHAVHGRGASHDCAQHVPQARLRP